jgi:hypothetical protein
MPYRTAHMASLTESGACNVALPPVGSRNNARCEVSDRADEFYPSETQILTEIRPMFEYL